MPVLLLFSLGAVEAIKIIVKAGPGPVGDAVNGTQPGFCLGRIENVWLGEVAAAFHSARTGRDSTYQFDVPSSGSKLKSRVAEICFRHSQLPVNPTSRS